MAQRLGAETPIIRCMPNTPAAIGKGMLVYCRNAQVSAECEAFVRALLTASGRVARVEDEALIDAVTAVSGSGPAYVFHFIECLTDAGVAAGLPPDIAAELAMQTVMGAGALAAQSADTPAKLREQVTSPNGTTAAALAVLMQDGRMKNLVGEAVEAARQRSVELGG
jgi:pyrroline-5-carboxylate reductase